MPRHLDIALDRLLALVPEIERVEHPSARGLEHHVPPAAPIVAYREGWFLWAELGFELAADARRRVRVLWSEWPTLRFMLDALVLWYPCAEFEGAFCRMVERELAGDFGGWLRWAPRLAGILRPAIIERAGRFNQIGTAIRASLVWARYFDGGDDAYRAFALALNRHDRVYAKQRGQKFEDLVRHDLNDHGTITLLEARAINRHLEALGAELLDLEWIRARGWWKHPAPDAWRMPGALAEALPKVRDDAKALAGDDWTPADDHVYRCAELRLKVR
jgi:hypothetical protein